jgi:hypothetical protein
VKTIVGEVIGAHRCGKVEFKGLSVSAIV